MNHYITGSAIRALREQQHLTQAQLAEKLSVSDKTISKWETGRGLPDISLLEPLAQARAGPSEVRLRHTVDVPLAHGPCLFRPRSREHHVGPVLCGLHPTPRDDDGVGLEGCELFVLERLTLDLSVGERVGGSGELQ